MYPSDIARSRGVSAKPRAANAPCPALQTAVEREVVLASSSTLSRWENRSHQAAAWRIHEVLVAQFIASFKRPPKKLVLDFDAARLPRSGATTPDQSFRLMYAKSRAHSIHSFSFLVFSIGGDSSADQSSSNTPELGD